MDFQTDFTVLVAQCAPDIHPQTITSIVEKESSFNPWALNVNGLPTKQQPKPKTKEEAVRIASSFISDGKSVDLGYGQINSANMVRLGLSVEQVLDPCTNLKTAAFILKDNYERAVKKYGPGNEALTVALSVYNTGHENRGVINGYVDSVKSKAASYAVPPIWVTPGTNQARGSVTLHSNNSDSVYLSPRLSGGSKERWNAFGAKKKSVFK